MSYNHRTIYLKECDCTIGLSVFGEQIGFPERTVHCETKTGEMRCEICGRIEKEEERI